MQSYCTTYVRCCILITVKLSTFAAIYSETRTKYGCCADVYISVSFNEYDRIVVMQNVELWYKDTFVRYFYSS